MSNKLECLICGKKFKRVCSHVYYTHGITAKEYKKEFGLPTTKSLMSDELKDLYRENALKHNMHKNILKLGAGTRFKEKGEGIGIYERSNSEKERIKDLWKLKKTPYSNGERIKKIKIKCALCDKEKEIYPRYLKEGNNYCGVICRNRAINNKNKK